MKQKDIQADKNYSPDTSAAHLRSHKDEIVESWKNWVLKEVPAAKEIGTSDLIDSLPKFLDKIAEELDVANLVPSKHVKNISHEHAEQRVETGKYSLEQVIREYRILRDVILKTLDEKETLSPNERDTILNSIDEGIEETTKEFLARKKEKRLVAERKLQEQTEALNTEKLKFEALFTQAPAAMALLRGPEHIFEKTNSFYDELIGHREVIGKTVVEAIPEVKDEGFIEILDTVFKTGEPFHGKEVLVNLPNSPEGPLQEKYVDFIYLRMNDRNGDPYGIFAHAVDVTEKVLSRKKIAEAHEELQKKEKLVRDFIEAMPPMAFIANAEGEIIFYNHRFYEYVGMGKETEGWGWKDRPVHHPDDLQRTIDTWNHSIKSGEPYEIEYRLRRYDGTYRWHLGRALPIKNEEGKIVRWLGTNTEIHDQKMMIGELELERSLRDQFVATLTHDLRNPLSAIKTSAQMILRTDKPEARERAATRIVSAVERADRMIKNLLDVHLIEAGKGLPLNMHECNLAQIAEEVIEEQKVLHANQFILESKGSVIGKWSCDGLRRIIDNLVSNAVKYGEPNTDVTVKIVDGPERVTLSVHNFGKPIPKEEQKSLFEAYRRSRSAQTSNLKGWGLGLTLVKGLADAHGGRVDLQSEERIGTTFFVELPKTPKT